MLLVISVPILLLIALGAWAFSSPVAASPDDDFHMVSIWCSGNGVPSVCESSGKSTTRYVSPALTESRCFVFLPKQSAGCQITQELFTTSQLIESDRGSFSSNYPPLYYAIMHFFAGTDIQFSVMMMRFVNVLIFLALNLWLWFVIPRKFHTTQILMWLVTLIPLGISIIASINPSSWAITGVGVSWLALYAWISGANNKANNKRQLASIFIVSSVMAMGARADAAIYVIIGIVTVLVLAATKDKISYKFLLIPILVVIFSILFFGMSGQSAVVNEGLPPEERSVAAPGSLQSQIALLLGNAIQLPSLFLGVFGYWNLGWNDTEMPIFTWVISGGIFSAVVFAGLRGMFRRQALAVTFLGVILYLIPLYVLQKSLVPVGTQVQPRYLLPLLLIFTGVALLPRSSTVLSFSKLQLAIISSGLSIALVLALHFNFRRYVTGVDVNNPNLNSNIEWWWPNVPSPMLIWSIGSIAIFLLALIFFRWYRTQSVVESDSSIYLIDSR